MSSQENFPEGGYLPNEARGDIMDNRDPEFCFTQPSPSASAPVLTQLTPPPPQQQPSTSGGKQPDGGQPTPRQKRFTVDPSMMRRSNRLLQSQLAQQQQQQQAAAAAAAQQQQQFAVTQKVSPAKLISVVPERSGSSAW